MLSIVKVQFVGECEFYCMPASDLCAVLTAEGRAISLESMQDFMNSLTQDTVTSIATNGWKLRREVLEAGQALMLPAGWMLSEAQRGESVAAGVLCGFLSSKAVEAAERELKALHEHVEFDRAWTAALLDVISLHKAASHGSK
eukprot:1753397-Lingulodinium_polyedra.AAC.1